MKKSLIYITKDFNKEFDKTAILELNLFMKETIEQKCIKKGVKLTEQKKSYS